MTQVDDVATLTRRIRLLVSAAIAYNVVEAVVALLSGAAASSTALVGFGAGSVIEVASALALAWQFSASTAAVREHRQRAALRITGLSFAALAAYLAVEGGRALLTGNDAHPAPVGIVLAVVSLVVMPVLSLAQRRAGLRLGSKSAVADSKQTLLCTYLSAVLLLGLLSNALLGWGWADPVAGLGIAGMACREGLNAWRGESCCPALPVDDCC